MNARVHPEATAASLSEGADYELLEIGRAHV